MRIGKKKKYTEDPTVYSLARALTKKKLQYRISVLVDDYTWSVDDSCSTKCTLEPVCLDRMWFH